jgi:uncharacterized protein YgiM (DUF1202 family)
MPGDAKRFAFAGAALVLAVIACNLPTATPTPDAGATKLAATVSSLETSVSASQTAFPAVEPPTPLPANTIPPLATATAANPLVIQDALCWVGPGSAYEVVSAVKTGTQVELVGRGSLSGWYIIKNPIYHDPCWIEAANLQIDPSYNLSGLPIINPPPSPTPTPTHTPKPTNTPTATNTP